MMDRYFVLFADGSSARVDDMEVTETGEVVAFVVEPTGDDGSAAARWSAGETIEGIGVGYRVVMV